MYYFKWLDSGHLAWLFSKWKKISSEFRSNDWYFLPNIITFEEIYAWEVDMGSQLTTVLAPPPPFPKEKERKEKTTTNKH